MTPEFYDKLLDTLHQAHGHARREGDLLASRVFEDASFAAARIAGELRQLARGEGVQIPGDKSLTEVLAEYEVSIPAFPYTHSRVSVHPQTRGVGDSEAASVGP